MAFTDVLLPEFDLEMATTRRVIAAVRDENASFRPHPRSTSMADLAVHVANLVTWVPIALESMEFDVHPPGGERWKAPKFESAAALVKAFDANVSKARAAIADATDVKLAIPWSFKRAGAAIFTQPRAAVLRGFVMNHMIHHRGQLTVYLRLCEIPVPSVYGPTADTPM
jgi:uncharacterized damage-inducible protein DinB